MGNTYKDKTTEQLITTMKLMKSVVIALAVVLLLLISISTYGMIVKDNNATFISLYAVAISCGVVIPVQLLSIKKIKEELSQRGVEY